MNLSKKTLDTRIRDLFSRIQALEIATRLPNTTTNTNNSERSI